MLFSFISCKLILHIADNGLKLGISGMKCELAYLYNLAQLFYDKWATPSENVFEHAQNVQIKIHPTHAQSVIRALALHGYIL